MYAIAIDDSDNVWMGTGEHIPTSIGGLAKFNGTSWIVYDNKNSSLPFNLVYALAIDMYGNKWIGSINFDEPGGLGVYRTGGVVLGVSDKFNTKAPS